MVEREPEQDYIAPEGRPRNHESLLVGLLVGAVVVAGAGLALFQDFVASFDRPVPAPPPRVDLIVALSGGSGRLAEAVRLLHEGRAPVLLLVGFQGPAVAARLGEHPDAAALAREGRIVVEPRSESTLDDARRTRALVEARGARSVLVITSVYHVPRAELTFQTLLPSGVAVYVRPVATARFRADAWDADEPSRRIVFGEFMKYLVYRVRLALEGPAASGAAVGDPAGEPGTPERGFIR